MPWDQAKYEQAKGIIAAGKEDPEVLKGLAKKVARYERTYMPQHDVLVEGMPEGPTAPAVRDQGAMEPTPAKPLEKAAWIPSRPLSVPDYIPADAGGKLVNWRS